MKSRFTHHASRITALALCLFSLVAHAGRVTVRWDASPDAATNAGVTYVLYADPQPLSETNLATAAVRAHVGTNLTASALFTNAGRWYLVATARLDGVESEPSNMLAIEVPPPATNLRTLAVEYTLDLSHTNGWQDTIFFRLKPGP